MTTIHKFHSVGDWEALFINGESVKQNHIGRIDVLQYIKPGMKIEKVVSQRVNLPEGDTRYPPSIDEVVERDDYDFNGDDE